jgi:3-deoxy-7-phosphoheptulonate synthase
MNLWPTPRYPQVLNYKSTTDTPIVIAGPCFAEPEIVGKVAKFISKCEPRPTFMRGGVYRAGTYPPAGHFGIHTEALDEFYRQANNNGIGIILEVLDIRLIDYLAQFASAFQVGARHMQDYALLRELKAFDGIVTIKRGVGQTLDELLGAVEYLMGGNCKPVIIERGGSTYHNHVRWDLSISLIAAVKAKCGVPIIVDASHGTGRADLVEPMTLAGVAAGADGWLLETHPTPEKSLSDANQAINLEQFKLLNRKAATIHNIIKRGKK